VQDESSCDRKELAWLLKGLDAGDVVLVTRLDRLARSTRDLLNILAGVAEKGAAFRSLADNWADTTTAHGRLMLTVLGGLAEFERELIKSRTQEGRARAVARGKRMGRPYKLTSHQRRSSWNGMICCIWRHRSARVPLHPRRFSKSWLLHRIRVSWLKLCGSSAVSSDPCS
jgi:DNA invertase Pin-like site-specific DNA recombinase